MKLLTLIVTFILVFILNTPKRISRLYPFTSCLVNHTHKQTVQNLTLL